MPMNVTRKEQKRQEAEARNASWAALSLTQQLAHLDKMFGEGKGATKQRAKIAKAMAVVSNQPKTKKAGNPKGKAAKKK
jgi:hypothetical protein